MSDAPDSSTPSQSRLAYLKLESLIVTLRLAPGSLVTEKQLIAELGFGRTPVREAIQKLEWQGLIAIKPRAGLQIAALNADHPAMVLQTRRQLEPLAARLMASAITAEARQRLIDCAKAMTECAVTGDKEGFLAADKSFDEVLEDTCPNPFLSQALGALQTHSRRYWYHSANQASLDLSVSLHVRVIRALLQGDAGEAERAMGDLIDGLRI
ncbi:DNA-binding GntR family transcriptional regulator [Rhizobium sp. SG_E_25_P2]|jgi:DNA-binding GntR family transcriptional regulator|uniref:GntR family transcriptional regulator n=1 Tax=Rhizobium sp. SG_E_25_P2 TaxID=2879942 RepID=UPI00247338C5|nr:GntR family transcriptional regulator [Rhizobium sp. SG_E_25_P2]MDH6268602.1 DNA-binding GntR family transcriptional regulator [Rhizobium sp. SG_E_25_P2]